MSKVCLINAGLDEQGGRIIIRGSLDLSCLGDLLVDDYQRERLPGVTIDRLKRAFEHPEQTSVPDIDLGMRGCRTRDKNGTFTLLDPVFVIDGLQRKTAADQLVRAGKTPRLGAVVHVDTTKEWELERFRRLNADRTKLSANVLLRNMRDAYDVVATLQRLTRDDSECVLQGKVCWQQRKNKSHLLTAVVFLKTCGALHSHYPGGLTSGIDDLVVGCDRIMKDNVGKVIFRGNVRTFFGLVDHCWGITTVQHPDAAPQLRSGFLRTLARILADHKDFWRGERLFVSAPLRRKLKGFSVLDPLVIQLCGAKGGADKILYDLVCNHVNRGKTTCRLQLRKVKKDSK
jgi:hypothetical protein